MFELAAMGILVSLVIVNMCYATYFIFFAE